MDRELRNLERLAAAGDPQALHRLLLRQLALGDFDLGELREDVRIQMIMALQESLGSELSDAAYLLSFDTNLANTHFFPNHDNNMICPNGHICLEFADLGREMEESEKEAEFEIHHVVIGKNLMRCETSQYNNIHYYVADHTGADELWDSNVEFGLIECTECHAVWPSKGNFTATSGWD